MNKKSFSILSILALVVVIAGCASLGSGNTEALLSAAGFRTRTPTTEKQIAIFNSLTPYQVQRHHYQGKILYVYANPKQNLLYIGGETEYQAFQRLAVKQQISANNLAAAQINQSTMWGPWGPMGVWW